MLGILIPRVAASGLSRAGIALYDLLHDFYDVTIYYVGARELDIGNRKAVCLASSYWNLLTSICRDSTAQRYLLQCDCLVTMGLVPDIAGILARKHLRHIASIRGNLYVNYFYDYGVPGRALAFLHYFLVARFTRSVALNTEIKQHIDFFLGNRSTVIANFLSNEQLGDRDLFAVQQGRRLVYTGSLSKRKSVHTALNALAVLKKKGEYFSLAIVGTGPEESRLKELSKKLGIEDRVVFVGQVGNVDSYLSAADIFILTSLSEGTSRSAMEALAAGLPVVARYLRCNKDLIMNGVNGYLFAEDRVLSDTIMMARDMCLRYRKAVSLLPYENKQSTVRQRWIDLISSS